MVRTRVFVLFIFCSPALFSQRGANDSLWGIYNNRVNPDTVRLKAIHAIARSYVYNNPDTALILAGQELQLAQTAKQKKYEGKTYNTLGVAFKNKGDYPKAIEYYLKSLQLFEETGDKEGISICYTATGNIYYNQANFPKALENYLKSLKIREGLGDKKGAGDCYINIGNVYADEANLPKALEYYLKALKIKEEIGDKQGRGNCYSNIGIVYQEQSDLPKALAYQLKALEIREETGNKKGMGACYDNIGTIYQQQLNLAKALEYYLKALKIRQETGDKQGIGNCYLNLGILHNRLANHNPASYQKALQYSDSALRLSKEIGDVDKERKAYQTLADVCAKTGKYKEAYENHMKFKQLTDSIFNTENSKQLGDMKTQFEVEKKEAELKIKTEAQEAISREEKKKGQIVIYAVGGVLFLALVFSLFLFNRFRITRRQKKVIEEQKVWVDKAYGELHEKNKEVMDSIYYARRIQRSLLTGEAYIERQLARLRRE